MYSKIRKYVITISIIILFSLILLFLKNGNYRSFVIALDISIFCVLGLDLIDCTIKLAHEQTPVFVRHAIGLLFILPLIITMANKAYDFNLAFVGILFIFYDAYTLVFYAASQEYNMKEHKMGLLKDFLLQAPPKIMIGIMSMILSAHQKLVNINNERVYSYLKKDVDICKTMSLICVIIYSVVLFVFIILDIINLIKNKNHHKKEKKMK